MATIPFNKSNEKNSSDVRTNDYPSTFGDLMDYRHGAIPPAPLYFRLVPRTSTPMSPDNKHYSMVKDAEKRKEEYVTERANPVRSDDGIVFMSPTSFVYDKRFNQLMPNIRKFNRVPRVKIPYRGKRL